MSDDRSLLPKMHPELLGDLRPFLRRPLSSQRWGRWKHEVLAELYERATRNGSTPEEELIWATLAAVQIAQHEGREEDPRPHAEWVLWYRCRIQNHVTDDLLGPDWRERERDAEARNPELEREEPDTLGRLEASSELDAVHEGGTQAEQRFLELWLDLVADGWDPKSARREAGIRTGRNANATRQLVSRIRRRNVLPFSPD